MVAPSAVFLHSTHACMYLIRDIISSLQTRHQFHTLALTNTEYIEYLGYLRLPDISDWFKWSSIKKTVKSSYKVKLSGTIYSARLTFSNGKLLVCVCLLHTYYKIFYVGFIF